MNILTEIGLSQREIAVYKALLKLGSTTTGPLVKESAVQNAKIYETLDKLIKKGLATYVLKGKIKHFQATNPNTLLSFFENKRTKLENTIKELHVLQNRKKPEYEARVYEGIKAIKSAFFEMYDHIGRDSEYCVFPLGEQLGTEELAQFWAEVFLKRLRMKIKIRTLPNIRLKKIFERSYKRYRLIKIRYTRQKFPTGIFIFKDHILNVTWSKKPVAFLIRSKESSQRWQRFFEEQWKR